MLENQNAHTAIAKMVIQKVLLDRKIAEHHQSLATFAHELELVEESRRFGLVSYREVEEVEDRLITAWHGLIELSSRDLED